MKEEPRAGGKRGCRAVPVGRPLLGTVPGPQGHHSCAQPVFGDIEGKGSPVGGFGIGEILPSEPKRAEITAQLCCCPGAQSRVSWGQLGRGCWHLPGQEEREQGHGAARRMWGCGGCGGAEDASTTLPLPCSGSLSVCASTASLVLN